MGAIPILVIEDDQAWRETLLNTLEEAGYTPTAVATGADALAQLPILQPKLILLDIRMPDLDGIQFLARVRAEPA